MYSIFLCSCIGYVLGILLAKIDIGFCIIFAAVSAVTFAIRRDVNVCLIMLVMMFCFGNIRINSAINADSVLDDYKDEYVYITARVCDAPRYGDVNSYVVETQSFKFQTGDISHKTRMKISAEAVLKYGDIAEFYGVLRTYEKPKNSYSFDTKAYNNERGIFYKMFSEYSVVTDTDARFSTGKIRSAISDSIYTNELNSDYRNIMSKVYLDMFCDTEAMLYDSISQSQLAHLLYSARVHIVIIVWLMFMLKSRISKKIRDIILVCIAVVYCILNPASGSALRIMGCSVGVIVLVRLLRFHDFCDTICFVTLVIGIINPLIVKSVGYILSVSMAIGMNIFCMPIYQYIKDKLRNRHISAFLAAFIVLFAVMLPVSAYIGLRPGIYSFILMPMFALICAFMWVLLPVYIIAPQAVCSVLHGLCAVVYFVADMVERLPLSQISLPRISAVLMIAVLLLFLGIRYKNKNFVAVSIAFSLVFACGEISGINELSVHFVSVGQGDGAVVSLPYRNTILIDGGGTEPVSEYDHGMADYIPYLEGNGFSNIDAALVSHYHEDHALGVLYAVESLKVKKLYLPFHAEGNEVYDALIACANKRGTDVVILSDGDVIQLGDIRIDVFCDINTNNANEACAVYRISYGDFEALFTGDIGDETESALSERNISSDILKVPHHGSKNSSTEKFLKSVNPRLAVAGIGENNVYGFPKEETLYRYKSLDIPFLSTAVSGNIVVKSGKDGDFKVYRN